MQSFSSRIWTRFAVSISYEYNHYTTDISYRPLHYITDVLLWTSLQWNASVGWPTRIYLQQLYADTACSLEGLLGAMDDKVDWREREREREREGESEKSVLAAWLDDDYSDEIMSFVISKNYQSVYKSWNLYLMRCIFYELPDTFYSVIHIY